MSKTKIALFHRVPGSKTWTRNTEHKPKTLTDAKATGYAIKGVYGLEVKIIETVETEFIL